MLAVVQIHVQMPHFPASVSETVEVCSNIMSWKLYRHLKYA